MHPDVHPSSGGNEISASGTSEEAVVSEQPSVPTRRAEADGDDGQNAEEIKKQVTVPTRDIPVDDLAALVRRSVDAGYVFISDENLRPQLLYHDLDRNGLEDVFFLLVEIPEAADSSFHQAVSRGRVAASVVSDMARLFSDTEPPYQFHLAVLLRLPDGQSVVRDIPLGSWYVFDRFSGLMLGVDGGIPYCASVGFQTHEGRETLWVVFSSDTEYTFFSLKNSISVTSEARDIDQNGIIDIVEWRRVFEEGTGYETFLTWYKWDGASFTRFATSNIVRNLNRFLQRAGYLLSSGKWEQTLDQVLQHDVYSRLSETMDMEDIFLSLFPPQPESARPSGSAGPKDNIENEKLREMLSSDDRIFNVVVFPQVLENPFAAGDGTCCEGYKTRFSVRFVFRDGRSLVRECTVRMNGNPFSKKQFFLEPVATEK